MSPSGIEGLMFIPGSDPYPQAGGGGLPRSYLKVPLQSEVFAGGIRLTLKYYSPVM
jgi:hypothetical protein